MTKQPIITRILNDICTTSAGDYCASRIQGHILLIAFLILSAYVAIHEVNTKFDYLAFAGGGASIVAATAGAVRMKDIAEPQPPPTGNPDQEKP